MTRSLALSGHVPGDHQRLAPPYCLLDGKHQSGGANAAACMFRPPFHNETWILLPRFPRHCCAVNAPCGMRDALATPGAALPLDTANQLPQPVFALPLLIGPVRAPGRRHAPFRVVFPPVLLTTPTYCWLGRRGLADNDDCKPWAEDRRRGRSRQAAGDNELVDGFGKPLPPTYTTACCLPAPADDAGC